MLKGYGQEKQLFRYAKNAFFVSILLFFGENALPITRAHSAISSSSEINVNNKAPINTLEKSKKQPEITKKISSKLVDLSKYLSNSMSKEEKLHPLVFFVIAILLTLVLLPFTYWLYYKNSAKAYLRKNYNRFEVNKSTQQLLLFFRHQSDVSKIIAINTISECGVYLNDQLINSINQQCNFGNEAERKIRHTFDQEHRYKMINEKIRHIRLNIHQKKWSPLFILVSTCVKVTIV